VWEGLHVDEQGSVADILLEDPDAIAEKYKDAIVSKTGDGWYELSLFLSGLKGGTHAVVTASPILDNNGIIRGAIQTIQTMEKKRGLMGFGEEDGLGRFDEAHASPVFKVDSQGRITYWNESSEKEFGYPAPEMVGKSVFTFVSKRYRPLLKETIIGVLKGESYNDRAFKYYNQDGKPVYVLAKAFPVDVGEEEGRECVIINANVTDLRLRLKKLELYAAETKEKLKSLTEEYDLLKRNIASFIRKKDETQP
jgi:PAS domain S-box-containing protein